jgi:hypothetical protein
MQTLTKELRKSLISAPDTKIAKVVRMVDALALRGPADDLIKPLRITFAHAMPARPLRFSRLLFLPLDRMIVQPSKYRLGQGQVPRTSIAPIARAVNAAMSGAERIEEMIADQNVDNDAVIAEAGPMLWNEAGKIIAEMITCPEWDRETSLPDPTWREIRTTFSGAMFIAERIWGDDPPGLRTELDVLELLRDVEENMRSAMPAILSLLLSLNHSTSLVLAAAARHSNVTNAMSNAAVAQAVEEISNTAVAKIGRGILQDAPAEASRIETFLRAVERRGHISRDQVKRARRETATQCADRLDRAVVEEFSPAMMSGVFTDQDVAKVESIARSIRDLELSGRTLSADPRFEASMITTWALLANSDNRNFEAADRARVAEIIFGPDRAESVLRF